MRQSIRYLTTRDGTQLAWTVAGTGPTLVRAANWLTHLQYDHESPVWKHWIEFLCGNFRLVRYDERDCGMSARGHPGIATDHGVDDLEDVMAVAVPEGRPILLGISQGVPTAIAYAVRHPGRVSRLILYGGFPTGTERRGDAEALRLYHVIVDLVRQHWGTDHPTLRQVFISRFVPDASPEQLDRLIDICRRSIAPEAAARIMLALAKADVRALLPQVRVPTLVVNASHDAVAPVSAGRELATAIPGAEFVQLESRNHVLLANEPAWRQFKELVLDFTGLAAGRDAASERFAALTPRERHVFAALSAGRSNAEIAGELSISEKTVRNMLTRIFDKIGVRSRAQAIVLARDQGPRSTMPS